MWGYVPYMIHEIYPTNCCLYTKNLFQPSASVLTKAHLFLVLIEDLLAYDWPSLPPATRNSWLSGTCSLLGERDSWCKKTYPNVLPCPRIKPRTIGCEPTDYSLDCSWVTDGGQDCWLDGVQEVFWAILAISQLENFMEPPSLAAARQRWRCTHVKSISFPWILGGNLRLVPTTRSAYYDLFCLVTFCWPFPWCKSLSEPTMNFH